MTKTTKLTVKTAPKEPFLGVVRELVRAYQAFEAYDARHMRQYGITVPQADVIFTLGNTEGMVFKEIGKHTLITKGTLTGVVNRLEEKGLVKRSTCPEDHRRMYVLLTTRGEKLFRDVFPKHISYMKQRFDQLSKKDMKQAEELLKKIKNLF